MSLDITLYGPEETKKCTCPHCDNEHEHIRKPTLFSANITHNLSDMADEAGLYGPLWHPKDNGIMIASQLIPLLETGISQMRDDPSRFEAFNAKNGWGLYNNFLPWLDSLLTACRAYPEAEVYSWV